MVGGWVSLNQTAVPSTSAALIADNSSQNAAIFLGLANGIQKMTLASTGSLGLGDPNPSKGTLVVSLNSASGIGLVDVVKLVGADGQSLGMSLDAYTNSTAGSQTINGIVGFRSANGSGGGPSALGSASFVGGLGWSAYNGVTWPSPRARIVGVTSETQSTTNEGIALQFDTTPAGGTARSQALRLMAGLIVGAGTTDPAAGNVTASGFHRAADSTALQSGGNQTTAFLISNVPTFGVFCGTGVPTISAGTGSLYLRNDGATATTRMYINQNGSTTWTGVTTQA